MNQENINKKRARACDFCEESEAILYCRADSAKLCLACDREVHSTNPLFKKHTRCLLCDACDSSPSTIFCYSELTVLCQNCDWERHSGSGLVHYRRPVEGFCGCPCVNELLGLLGFEDLGKKDLVDDEEGEDGLSGFVVWETPNVVSLDDLIMSSDDPGSAGHGFQAMGVPPLPKNRNAVCGKHKQEILHQLREMGKTEPDFNVCLEDFEPDSTQVPEPNNPLNDSFTALDYYVEPPLVPSCEVNEGNTFQWYNDGSGVADQGYTSSFFGSFVDTNHLVPDKDSDHGDGSCHANIGQDGQSLVPDPSKNILVQPKVAPRELNSQERDSALSRYKEKKKTRRYDKHVRYESRKVRAESRMRIKGRFAKMDH